MSAIGPAAGDAGELPCIRCGDCNRACPEGLPVLALLDAVRADRDDLATAAGIEACTTCAACDAACPSAIPLARRFAEQQSLRRDRSNLLARAVEARRRFDARNLRLRREASDQAEREAARLRDASSADAVAAAIARANARRAGKPAGGA